MILVLEPNTLPDSTEYKVLLGQLERLPGIQFRVHREVGTEVTLTELYLIGNTGALTVEQMQVLPCVAKVVRVSEAYRVLGRHKQGDDRPSSFDYNGVHFGQDSLHVFAGLCAVDSADSVVNIINHGFRIAAKGSEKVKCEAGLEKHEKTEIESPNDGESSHPILLRGSSGSSARASTR